MNPYFCECCSARYQEAGDCKTCPEEALLDLRNDDVIELLENFDSSRYVKRTGMYSLGLGFLFVPIFYFSIYIDVRGIACAYITCVLIGTAILTHMFPPLKKCPPVSARTFSSENL